MWFHFSPSLCRKWQDSETQDKWARFQEVASSEATPKITVLWEAVNNRDPLHCLQQTASQRHGGLLVSPSPSHALKILWGEEEEELGTRCGFLGTRVLSKFNLEDVGGVFLQQGTAAPPALLQGWRRICRGGSSRTFPSLHPFGECGISALSGITAFYLQRTKKDSQEIHWFVIALTRGDVPRCVRARPWVLCFTLPGFILVKAGICCMCLILKKNKKIKKEKKQVPLEMQVLNGILKPCDRHQKSPSAHLCYSFISARALTCWECTLKDHLFTRTTCLKRQLFPLTSQHIFKVSIPL